MKLKRKDWARGFSRPRANGAYFQLGVAAIFFSIAAGVVPFSLEQGGEIGPHHLLFIFPVVGSILLILAVGKIISQRHYGTPLLDLPEAPLSLGTRFTTKLRLRRPVERQSKIHLGLVCLKWTVTTDSKGKRSGRESPLWRGNRLLPGGSREIAVDFEIPSDLPPWNEKNSEEKIYWRLEVESRGPGPDLDLSYDLPVADTGKGNASWTRDNLPGLKEKVDGLSPKEANSFSATPYGDAWIVRQKALRVPGLSLGVMFFGFLFLGPLLLQRYDKLQAPPVVGPLIVAVFTTVSLLFMFAGLKSLLVSRELRIGPNGLRKTTTILGVSVSSKIPWEEVHDFEVKRSASVGSLIWSNVRARKHSRRFVTLFSYIEDEVEARWLVKLLRDSSPKA